MERERERQRERARERMNLLVIYKTKYYVLYILFILYIYIYNILRYYCMYTICTDLFQNYSYTVPSNQMTSRHLRIGAHMGLSCAFFQLWARTSKHSERCRSKQTRLGCVAHNIYIHVHIYIYIYTYIYIYIIYIYNDIYNICFCCFFYIPFIAEVHTI